MKNLVTIVRILVGVLFIISGLVKANDPLGLSYKMQEFFEAWSSDLSASSFFLKNSFLSLFSFFHEHSLPLAIGMIALEIIAGVSLLIGWRPRPVTNLLLLLMIFFTFLTGYAFASGKFKNCGCFGDCLLITPLTSFLKDIVLLLLIVFLVAARKYILPAFSRGLQSVLLIVSICFTLGLQWYVLNYLPLADCLPFKKGASIAEGMKIPANAVSDSFAIRFVYQKEGKQYEFSPADLPADLGTYQFVSRKDQLIRKGNAEPAIKGFSLITANDIDSTQAVLDDARYSVFYFINPQKDNAAQWSDDLIKTATAKNIPVHFITADYSAFPQHIINTENTSVFKCDVTVFRTAARTNPCIYLIKKGTVINKWSIKEVHSSLKQLQALPVQNNTPPQSSTDNLR